MKKILFLSALLCLGRLFGQEINGDIPNAGMVNMCKINNCFYVYGLKDKNVFKVIKYDINLKVLKEYEKPLGDDFKCFKFINLRNKLEFNLYNNLRRNKGAWVKLDYDLNELDFTPYGETESKSAVQNKTADSKENYTPLIYTDPGNYDDMYEPRVNKYTCLYQDGEFVYIFQEGSEGTFRTLEKGLYNKTNAVVRKYKIKSDKGFPVLSLVWESNFSFPYLFPVQVVPELSKANRLAFIRSNANVIFMDKQLGKITDSINLVPDLKDKPDFFYAAETLGSKYIPEKEIFVSCGTIGKWSKNILKKEYEMKTYFINVYGKDGKIKNKVEESIPEYAVRKRDAINLKYRNIYFHPNGIICEGNKLTVYGINTVEGLAYKNDARFSMTHFDILIAVSAHKFNLTDYEYKYSQVLFEEYDKLYGVELIHFKDIVKNENGDAILQLEDSEGYQVGLFGKKCLKYNSGIFTDLKAKWTYDYFIKDMKSIYFFDKKGNDGKYKITTIPQ